MNAVESLAHTLWECKYHVAWICNSDTMDICGWSGGTVSGGAKRFCQTEPGRGLRYQKYAAGRAFSAMGVFLARAKRGLWWRPGKAAPFEGRIRSIRGSWWRQKQRVTEVEDFS